MTTLDILLLTVIQRLLTFFGTKTENGFRINLSFVDKTLKNGIQVKIFTVDQNVGKSQK